MRHIALAAEKALQHKKQDVAFLGLKDKVMFCSSLHQSD